MAMTTAMGPTRMRSSRPTIRQVAQRAGVAIGTVSRVLNKHPTVEPAIRLQVEQAIAEMGYQPDALAGSLRRSRTQTIGCAIRDFDLPGFAAFLTAAEERFRAAGCTMLLANTENDKAIELSLLRTFASRRADGILMTLSDESDADLLAVLGASKAPIVLIDRNILPGVDCITADHEGGVRQATAYLLSLGHRRIALLTGEPTSLPASGRIAGYRAAFAAAGLPPPARLIRTRSFSAGFGFEETMALLAEPLPPTAIIAGGMGMLAGVLRALRQAGRAVGREVSVIGSESDLAELVTPGITAIDWDLRAMGRDAAGMLLDRIEQRVAGGPRHRMLPTRLILRGSCAAPVS